MQNSINDATPYDWDSLNKLAKDMQERQIRVDLGISPNGLDQLALDPNMTKYQAVKEHKASSKQIGGNHYKGFAIQPAEFCYKNNIPYLEATAIKYLCRWKDKGGIQDLDKAIHFIQMLKEFYNDN